MKAAKQYDPMKRRERYLARADEAKASQRRWNRENSFHRRAHNANVRARQYGVEGTLTADDIRACWRASHGLCVYCQERQAEQLDHVVPLSRGGKNVPGNIVAGCVSCNGSKGARLVSEWLEWTAKKAAANDNGRVKT